MSQSTVHLSVHPTRVFFDQKFTKFQIEKALPGSKLTVHASNMSTEKERESFGHYVADANGTVNVLEDLCLGGTYSGVRPMGLLETLKVYLGDIECAFEVTISVFAGHQSEGFSEGQRLGCVLVQRWFMSPGVQRIELNQPDLDATLYLPPGQGPWPGVLDLWGDADLRLEHRAALLASRGFAAMFVNYINPEISGRTGGFVDDKAYIETAYLALQRHPQVDGSRIAMIGLCLGGSRTLKMAAYSDVIKLSCAVSINGFHVYPAKGTLDDYANFHIENIDKRCFDEKWGMICRNIFLPIPDNPQLNIDMGRVRCPLMVIAGDDDQNIPSHECALHMEEMMKKAGNGHLLTVLLYPKAGHILDTPYQKHNIGIRYIPTFSTDNVSFAMGGEPVAHSFAQEDSWKKMLAFLNKHLYSPK